MTLVAFGQQAKSSATSGPSFEERLRDDPLLKLAPLPRLSARGENEFISIEERFIEAPVITRIQSRGKLTRKPIVARDELTLFAKPNNLQS